MKGNKRGKEEIRRYKSRKGELFSLWETELMGDKVIPLARARFCHREEGNKFFSLSAWTGQEKWDEAVVRDSWC